MEQITRQVGEIDRHLHKEEIITLASQHALTVIDNGKSDILSVYVELKRYETYLKGFIAQLKTPALEKAMENGDNKFDYDDAIVRITHRIKWDYSSDLRWLGMKQLLDELTSEKKAREEFLKENNNEPEVIDPETGEVIEAYNLTKDIVRGIAIQL